MQRASPTWIAEAAARAEQRLRGDPPGYATPIKQLRSLIDAIMDTRVKRDELRKIAKSMGEGA